MHKTSLSQALSQMSVRRPLFFVLSLLVALSSLAMLPWGTARAAALAVDKQVFAHPTSPSTSITSPAFTTSQAGELLVAFVMSDGSRNGNSSSFTSVTGGNLTWRLRQRANAQAGTSEIWTAVAPNVLTNANVRATRSGSYVSSLVVTTFTGADTTTDGAVKAASGSTGAPSLALTTTRAGSWVWAVGNDWDGASARTVGSGQTKVDEYLPSVGDTFWVQRQTNPTPTAGASATMNDTAPTNHRWNLAAIEILQR